jgi:AraC-like DNA-binding protein
MGAGVAIHHRTALTASAAPVVAGLFVVEPDLDTPLVSIPRPEPQFVVRFGPAARNGLDVCALGARGRVHRKVGGREQRAVVACLYLGTAESVLGASASAIAGRIVPLEDLWGAAAARRLADRLFSARDMGAAAGIVEMAIADRLAVGCGVHRHAQLAVNAAKRLSRANVRDVAADLDVSERHLRRVFREVVGVSPKAFTTLTRFRRALRAARDNGHANWASIAAAAGYYDQAHLIAEFRAIAGAPPRAFLNELRAALSVG